MSLPPPRSATLARPRFADSSFSLRRRHSPGSLSGSRRLLLARSPGCRRSPGASDTRRLKDEESEGSFRKVRFRESMEACLTRWAVAALSNDEEAAAGVQLVLQVVDVRPLSPTQERYRMSLSDGGHLMQGILLTSMNHLVKDGRLHNGAVVRLLKFVCKTIECLRVVVVFQLDVLLRVDWDAETI